MTPVITKDTAKDFMNILVTDYDTILDHLVSVASETIETYCNQPVVQDLVTMNFKGNAKAVKFMDYFPVQSINAIQYQTDIGEDWTAVDSSDYELYEDCGAAYVYYPTGFSSAYRYKIGINTGYSSAPYDIQQIATEMVADLFKKSDVNGDGRLGVDSITNNQINVVQTTKYIDLNKSWQDRLSKYRRLTI